MRNRERLRSEKSRIIRSDSARERVWKTKSGKAKFTVPKQLSAMSVGAPGRHRLITLRSNDQFNTTIDGDSDRMRGIEGRRDVLLMNPADIRRAGPNQGQVASHAEDGVERQVSGLTVTPFELPDGCVGAYCPEMNVLVPLWYDDQESKTPAVESHPCRDKAVTQRATTGAFTASGRTSPSRARSTLSR